VYARNLESGGAALEQGQPEDAADAYRAALDLRPDSAPALLGLARTHLALGEGEQALAVLARLEREHPGFQAERAGAELRRALFAAAEERLRRGDSAGALRVLGRLAELEPGYPGREALEREALLAEAGRLRVAGRLEEAQALLRELRSGTQQDPDLALAAALLEGGRVDTAISILSDALTRRPGDARLRALMARALRIRYPNGLFDELPSSER
jgi:predicted Zn-dependent protease